MKRSKFPRKLKKAVNTMRVNEYITVSYWGRRSRRRTKWVVRGELEFRKLYDEIKRGKARLKELKVACDIVERLMARH